MLDRRAFLRLAGKFVFAGASLALYGAVVEPLFGLRVTRYQLTPSGWPPNLRLRVAVIADLHACDPWMTDAHVAEIVELTNGLAPDCVLLAGDYIATHAFQAQQPMRLWAEALAKLRAPLGAHAVMGNHDWWMDWPAMRRGDGLPRAGEALRTAGIAVYQNDAVRLQKDVAAFWLVGLGDQLAFAPLRGGRRKPDVGIDDLDGALRKVTDDSPVILLAHEPDIFPRVPERVCLTLCGHTHGGQIAPFGWRGLAPSRYGARYAYGHVEEEGRSLIVSGGLGCSVLPLRIGSRPEVVMVELGGESPA